ncbi:hypothetical protein, conserved [Trypanosoma brucei gambiense DAL972]|uniref:Uncharacterized protein n=1 Tax=Trypanosoma brucei gambiense (strain MHOM/CI/86/DAL972) TaxID=679716 RepID=D0AA85_TRYB9|nr:hypothetical protein, conserved [Trypanosoma brucei gambiense DAL972]CBH18586.1 hypothetical protein, conserved [Trypanosoma brucei gambiense DAL972]|eukprot:XP_011780850.1 hypothetical protein, conserved [Trypanosoma brucei gambiense DAL972]
MAKKHRVKRQKQVEYLLRLERERDEYLAKRKRAKRDRRERNEGELFGEALDNLAGGDVKRERKEGGISASEGKRAEESTKTVSTDANTKLGSRPDAASAEQSKVKHLRKKY